MKQIQQSNSYVAALTEKFRFHPVKTALESSVAYKKDYIQFVGSD